ncbi:MAG: CvpA family protein [Novosphingobium sp.]
MTGFDIAVLLLVGLGAITGFMRGFVQEVLTLAAWVLSVFAIHSLHTPLSDWLIPRVGTESGAMVLAFAILLLIPYAIVKLLAGRLGAASRESVLGPIDRVLGFGFGAMKGVLIAVMAFSVLVLGYDTVWVPKDGLTGSASHAPIRLSMLPLLKWSRCWPSAARKRLRPMPRRKLQSRQSRSQPSRRTDHDKYGGAILAGSAGPGDIAGRFPAQR